MTRVSVIIPTHNRAALAREAAASALRQSRVDVEVIVVDDGSTDDTQQALAALRGPITFMRQERSGACAARNRGLAAATGDFIKFLDSDDLLEPDSLADQTRDLQSMGADVSYGLWTEFGEGGDPATLPPPLMPFEDPIDSLLSDWWAPPCAYLLRAPTARSVEWDPVLTSAQDFDTISRIALKGARFVHTPTPVARYRHHASDRVSRRSMTEWAANRARVLQKIHVELERAGNLTPSRRGMIALQLFRVAQAARPTDPTLFAALLDQTLRIDPEFLPPNWLHALFVRALGFENGERLLTLRRRVRGRS